MSYKNIIFDVGGVLLEWNPRKIIQELGLPAHFWEVFNSLLWATHDGGLFTREEVVQKLPNHCDKKQFEMALKRLALQLRPIHEMIDLFQQFKSDGYGVYILSNMPRELHQELVLLHDFFSWPDGQVYSYDVKAIKPQPEIYQALLNRYQLKGEESLFIDDREDNIIAAKRLGIEGVLCTSPAQVKSELTIKKLIK